MNPHIERLSKAVTEVRESIKAIKEIAPQFYLGINIRMNLIHNWEAMSKDFNGEIKKIEMLKRLRSKMSDEEWNMIATISSEEHRKLQNVENSIKQ